MLNACGPPGFGFLKGFDGLMNAGHPRVVRGAVAPIDAIQNRGDIEKASARFEEELIQGTRSR